MKKLSLNAWDRLMLGQCLPQGGTLQQVADYLRIIEALRLKEEEREAVGWRQDEGNVTITDIAREFDIALEDSDFVILRECAVKWDRWPTILQTRMLKEKLDAAAAV